MPEGNQPVRRLRRVSGNADGFSLLEMMIALVIMLAVCGAAFSIAVNCQKSYSSTQLKADLHAGVRNATDLLQQELGQAGNVSLSVNCRNSTTSGCPTLSANVTGSTSSQTVNVSSNTGMYVGEKLRIDVGSAQEVVAITQCGSPCGTGTANTITGILKNNHTTGATVYATGVFPQGILSTSTATQLNMFGDINGDGSIVFVQYTCDTTAGTLTRSVTPITSTSKSAAVTLLDNLISNPGGSTCFQGTTSTTSVTASSGTTYTFIPNIGVMLTVQTAEIDPFTKAKTQETKAFLNLAPRNIGFGVGLAKDSKEDFLQPNPTSCLLAGTC